MTEYEKYCAFHMMQSDEIREELVLRLSSVEKEFLRKLLTMPEQQVFLEQSLVQMLKAELGDKTLEHIEILGEGRQSDCWDDPQYIENAGNCLDLILQNVDFEYENTTFTGTKISGRGCPIAIQVDSFTREWYLNFVDIDRKDVVLSSIRRLDIQRFGKGRSMSLAECMDIREERRNKEVLLSVKNDLSAMERACALFSQQKRHMQYDKENDRMLIRMKYFDYEEKEILTKILSLGSMAVILESDELKKQILEIIDHAVAMYTEVEF